MAEDVLGATLPSGLIEAMRTVSDPADACLRYTLVVDGNSMSVRGISFTCMGFVVARGIYNASAFGQYPRRVATKSIAEYKP